MTGFTNRKQLLSEMQKGDHLDWDIIVIGGGITGAGILREARRRGFKALLLEQQDFSWGTSSRSSKMVHGGLRYLASGDYKLTKESVQERQRLLNEAPGLVDPISFYLTFRKGLFPGRFVMKVILTIYDFFASTRDNKYFNNKELQKRFHGLDDNKLNGYWDRKSWVKVGGDIVIPDNSIQTIFMGTDLDKIMRAKALIVHKDIKDQREFKFTKFGEPFPMGLRHKRYFGCFWERA